MQRLILPFLFLVSLKLALHSSQKSYSGNTATAYVSGLNTSAPIVYNRTEGTVRFPATLFGLDTNTPTPVVNFSIPKESQVNVSSLDFSGLTIPAFTLTRNSNQYSGTVSVNNTNRTLTVTDTNDTDSDGIPDLSDLAISQKPSFPFPQDHMYILRATNQVTLNWQVTATNADGYYFTNLPPGLTGHSTGVLDGAPHHPGTFRATVTATNFSGASHRDLDIFVLPKATNLPWSDNFSADPAATNYLIVPEGSGTFTSTNSRLTFSSPANTNATNSGNFVKAFPNLQLSLTNDWEAEVEVALPTSTNPPYNAVGLGLFPEDPQGDLLSIPDWFSLELGQEFGVQRVWAYVRQKKTAHGGMESTLAESLDSPTRANLRLQYRAADKILVSSYRSLPSGPWVTLLTNTLNYYDYGPNSIGYRWDMTNLAATTLRVALWAESYEPDSVSPGTHWLDNFSIQPGAPPAPTHQTTTNFHPVGSTLTLQAPDPDSGPLSYQWQHNGTNLPGQTNPTLLLFSNQPSHGGTYSVVLSNLFGSVTSPVAVLDFLSPPAVSASPEFLSRALGQSTNLSVAASGDGPLSYQWRLNGTDLPSATNATLSLTNLALSQAGTYSVVVTNPVGSVTSPVAVLAVAQPPPFSDAFDSDSPAPGWLLLGETHRPFLTNRVLAAGSSLSSARPPVSLPLTNSWVAEVDAVLTSSAGTNARLAFSLHPESAETFSEARPADRLDLVLTPSGTNRILQPVRYVNNLASDLPAITVPHQAVRLRLAHAPASGQLVLSWRATNAHSTWSDLDTLPLSPTNSLWNLHPTSNFRINLWGNQ